MSAPLGLGAMTPCRGRLAPWRLLALGACFASLRCCAQPSSSSSDATALVHSAAAGAAYMTTCMGQYTANPLTPQCTGSYADLQQLVMLLLEDPLLATPADLGTLQSLCTATGYSSCVNQLNAELNAYLKRVEQPTSTACDVALGPNAGALVQLLTDFLCLQNARGESCAQVVSLAAKDLGLTSLLTGRTPFVAKDVFTPSTCAVLNASSCCGAAALEVLYAVAQMTCHQTAANAAQLLASECVGMPPPCGAFNVPPYVSVTDCRGVSFPKDCATPGGSCPDSPCQVLCAIATNEPPVESGPESQAAQVAQVANHTTGLNTIQAAAYLTTCLELGAGKPLSPSCASTYADMMALLPQALGSTPALPFGADNAAALTQLCTPPARGQESCLQQQLGLFITWTTGLPQPSSTVCDYVLGPNVPGVGIYATYFTCLSNAQGQLCLPTVASALAAAGLGGVLNGTQSLDMAALDPSTLCPALGSTGCCAGAAVQVLSTWFAMTCQSAAAAALTAVLAQCDGVPAACPDFQLPAITPPAQCPDSITGPPLDCSFAPGQCPATPCEVLCGYANARAALPQTTAAA